MADAKDLRAALATVKHGLKEQQDWYLRLPLETRRDLRRPGPVDRFKCAAIFQHQPSTRGPYGYYIDDIDDLEPEENKKEPSAEICPFTDYFYASIENAQEALDDERDDEAAAFISTAFEQLNEVHQMLVRMSRRPKIWLEQQDRWRTLWAWNDACYWVQKGASVEEAIRRSLGVERGGLWNDDNKKDNGPRRYFFWDPNKLTFAAKPVYPTDLPEVNDIPQTKFKPTIEEWETPFVNYKQAWSTLSPHGSDFPHPLGIMKDVEPESSYTNSQPDEVSIKVVFLRGSGFETLIVRNPYVFEKQKLDLESSEMDKPQYAMLEKPQPIKDLEKHLSRVELRRWHPDQLNKRTGVPGDVDQEIGQKEENRKVFFALKDLVDMLKDPQERFLHPIELDSRWEERKKRMRFWKREREELATKMAENEAKENREKEGSAGVEKN